MGSRPRVVTALIVNVGGAPIASRPIGCSFAFAPMAFIHFQCSAARVVQFLWKTGRRDSRPSHASLTHPPKGPEAGLGGQRLDIFPIESVRLTYQMHWDCPRSGLDASILTAQLMPKVRPHCSSGPPMMMDKMSNDTRCSGQAARADMK
jgi:hypothetical protein